MNRRSAQLILADPVPAAWTSWLRQRVAHLAEASTGPDEQVAALLQDVAHANLFRGDSVGAIAELLRAADLSPVESRVGAAA